MTINDDDFDFQDDSNEYGVFSYKDPGSFQTFDNNGLQLHICTKDEFCLYHFAPKITHRFGKNMLLLSCQV